MSQPKGPIYHALQAAGYVRLPGLWVKAEDYELIKYLAEKHADEVNEIRGAVRKLTETDPDDPYPEKTKAHYRSFLGRVIPNHIIPNHGEDR
jgi:hypothetical protein